MKVSWEDVFRVVLQEIDANPDMYTNDIIIQIEDKLRKRSSEELSKIDSEMKSVYKDIKLSDSNYLQRIKNLNEANERKVKRCNEQYRFNMELLQKEYSADLTPLMQNNHQNIILVQANCEKTSDSQLRYENKSDVLNNTREMELRLLRKEHKIKLEKAEYDAKREKLKLEEEYNREHRKAQLGNEWEKERYNDVLKELRQDYSSIKQVVDECNVWKESGLGINYVFKVRDGSNHSSREYTLLHFAVNFGDTNVTNLLLAKGADVDVKDQNGSTPLHLSANNNHIKIVKLLVEKQANVDVKDHNGNTPLHLSANNNHIKIVKLLVEKQANVDVKDHNGNTPLHLSANNNHIKIVKLLVEGKADLNAVNKAGDTPLHLSAVKGHIGIVKLLVEKKADLNAVNKAGDTPLHLSAVKGHIGIAELLVEKKADLNAVNKAGDTPLHLSAVKGHIGIAELLVEKKADLNAVNKAGDTPLHLSAVKGHIGIVKLLVEKGADIHLVNKDGNTSLHSAFYKNYPKIVRYLMAKEPNMKVVVDSLVRCVVEDRTHTLLKGRTPLHLAAIYDCTEVVESLLAEGENPLLKDANGKTPRELATDESLIQLFGEAEIKQQEYNATKWALVSGGSAGALGITVATTLFATAVFTVGLLPIVTAVAAVMTLALAVGGTTYMILKPSAKIRESRIECEATTKSSFVEV